MAQAIALARTTVPSLEWLRSSIVCTCAMALIAAGTALPSLGL